MSQSLNLSLDRTAKVPLAEQIRKGVATAIEDGVLEPGARLPSWQDLAAQLGVARHREPRLPVVQSGAAPGSADDSGDAHLNAITSLSLWGQPEDSILVDLKRKRPLSPPRPSAPHTVQSLAHSAGMSRSAFMSRFTAVLGRAPMSILRDLRLRQAALDLTTTTTPVEVLAHNAGYESRSSFARRFAKVYGKDPTEYRAMANEPVAAEAKE